MVIVLDQILRSPLLPTKDLLFSLVFFCSVIPISSREITAQVSCFLSHCVCLTACKIVDIKCQLFLNHYCTNFKQSSDKPFLWKVKYKVLK